MILGLLVLRVAPLLKPPKIYQDKIEKHSVSEIPPRCIRKPTVNFTLHSGKESESNPLFLKENFHQLQSQFSDHHFIYTDGSKEDKKVQVGKDQEKTQSEKDSHSKNRGGKKPK